MTAPKKGADKALTSPKTAFAFEWLRLVARDKDLIKGSYRLAMVFAQSLWPLDADESRYYSKKSQGNFADEIGIQRYTVQKLFKDLVDRGHLEVVSRKGQGVVNYYMPILKPEPDAGADHTAELVEDPPELPAVEVAPEAAPSAGVEIFDPQTAVILEVVSNEELYVMEANHKYDIELLRSDDTLIDSADILSDIYEVFLLSFPEALRDGARYGARIWFLTLIHRGFDPSQLVIEAREYVRAARLAGQQVHGPLKWTHSRVKADTAERHSAEG